MAITKAQRHLIDVNKELNIDLCAAIPMSCLCKSDEHANAMAEYVRSHPNEDVETYIDKAYEIIGETRPEYYVDGKRV